MDYSLNLHETIGISDKYRIETELDAVIYRQRFEKFRSEYQRSHQEETLIFVFIILQVYVECFLHQNMRRIVELEFKSTKTSIFNKWVKQERRKVLEKLDKFAELFNLSSIENSQLLDDIKKRFSSLSHVRNQFVHGHKIAAWSDSEGNSGVTSTRMLLSDAQLIQMEKEINELGAMWNDLLDQVQSQCKALKRIDSFRFQNI